MLAQMFGMNMGAGGPMPGVPPRKRREKGPDEEQSYAVTLEELYRGKTAKFAVTKNVICSHCKGSGGKEKAKARQCSACQGQGFKRALRSVGPGLVAPEIVTCSSCNGRGEVYNPKDRCKKCKGERVTQARKVLELYIPRGSQSGDRITLPAEADHSPLYTTPGDIIFTLNQLSHPTFTRKHADLCCPLKLTLADALGGFSRTVVKHLDGRGIHITYPAAATTTGTAAPRTLGPGSILKVAREGMPIKRGTGGAGGEEKGDLYLTVEVDFPAPKSLELIMPDTAPRAANASGDRGGDEAGKEQLLRLLRQTESDASPSRTVIEADVVDEVSFDATASLDTFGARGAHGGMGGGDEEWSDADEDEDDDDGTGHTQCATQ